MRLPGAVHWGSARASTVRSGCDYAVPAYIIGAEPGSAMWRAFVPRSYSVTARDERNDDLIIIQLPAGGSVLMDTAQSGDFELAAILLHADDLQPPLTGDRIYENVYAQAERDAAAALAAQARARQDSQATQPEYTEVDGLVAPRVGSAGGSSAYESAAAAEIPELPVLEALPPPSPPRSLHHPPSSPPPSPPPSPAPAPQPAAPPMASPAPLHAAPASGNTRSKCERDTVRMRKRRRVNTLSKCERDSLRAAAEKKRSAAAAKAATDLRAAQSGMTAWLSRK